MWSVCCTGPRHIVSKKKRRTVVRSGGAEGLKRSVDLDLTVISAQIICMGVPARGVQAYYRNPAREIVDYLDHKYADRYHVYNLCVEPRYVYDPELFHGRVSRYPFPDHWACPLAMIPDFVADVVRFLQGGENRIIAIHCKAGKGRSGLCACCLLLVLEPQLCPDAEAAMTRYGVQRTHDGRGLTIPSQRRYVHYYEHMLRELDGTLSNTEVPTVRIVSVTLIGFFSCINMDCLRAYTAHDNFVDIPIVPSLRAKMKYAEGAAAVVETTVDAKGRKCVCIHLSTVLFFRRLSGDIRFEFRNGSEWRGALTIHTLFLKEWYDWHELDRVYKRKGIRDGSGMRIEYLPVSTSAT